MCSAALMAIGNHFDSTPIKSFAAQTRRHGFEDMGAEYANLLGAQDEIIVSAPETEQVDLSLPPGLDNLRNTCYLNSILQYFYTVTPVRELVLTFDATAAGLDSNLANQNEEVYLGRQCEYLVHKPSRHIMLSPLQLLRSSRSSSRAWEVLLRSS